MKKWNEVIRELRKEKGMTQIELAGKLGIARATLANYETGNREPELEVFEKFNREILNITK